jgi:hypothetical protein
MEEKINIAKILKDKPQGTKLYADAFGELEYCSISNDKDPRIFVEAKECTSYSFYNNGKYNKYGEPILFPSKEMRDWSKFAWKKGDVLVNSRGLKILFDRWANDNYTSFYAKTINLVEDGFLDTNLHTLASEEEAKSFIKCIEEKLGGKLNCETLEVEKAQPEFKDGDIVTMHKKNCDIVFIFNRLRTEGSFYYYAFHALQTNNTGVIDCHTTLPCAWTFFEGKMNFATDSEKQQLFSALAKEGKAWDAEKKQIVDLETKVELKPFDKVLVRDGKNEIWEPAFFFRNLSHLNVYNYQTVGGESRVYCIPFNEETAKLIGTTDDWEGGEV